ncbi:MAG: pyridoxamine 5'-phosphate oxidase family protein [Myxococcota bacterium]|nr:pyridoxamine 5'-phosphate oxidase family protein [Myxococcota bacterium]
MASVGETERAGFFAEVEEASKKAVWCAIGTAAGGEPRVRMVHPTWEGDTLWFATGTSSPKVAQLRANPRVDLQYQVAPPDFVHVMVRGSAEIVTDEAEKKRVWDVIDYDLGAFWPGGPTDPEYTLVRVRPERVELSKMFGSQDKRVWRA